MNAAGSRSSAQPDDGGSFADRLGGSRLISRAATVAGGTAAGQGIVALASLVLSRWFSPDDFGRLAVFLALSSLLGTCAAFRLEQAVQAAETDEEAHDVATLALRVAGCSGAIALVVVVVALIFDKTLALGSVILLVPVTGLAVATFNVGISRAIRSATFGLVARARIVLGAGTVAPQLIAGALGGGAFGLLIGPLFGWGLAALLLLSGTSLRFGQPLTMSWTDLIRRHRRFPTISVWSALFNRGALEVPAIMVLAVFDERSAGLFYLCNRVLVVPANVIADGFYQSFLNEAGALARTDLAELRRRTFALVRNIALAVVVPIAVAMVVVPPMFPIIFGEPWRDAGPIAVRLLPMIATLVIGVPVSSQLWLHGRHDLELARDIARFGGVLAVFIAANVENWSLLTAVTAYSIVMAVAYLTTTALALRSVSQAARRDVHPGATRAKV